MSKGSATLHFRTTLRPGDLGCLTYLHGGIYAQEYGWDPTFEAYVAAGLAEFVLGHDPARERVWIAEIGGETVGSIAIVRARGEDAAEDTAQLRWFLVKPTARGRGLGRRLVAEALDFCREAGYRRVILWTVRGLEAAAHLYRAAGFTLAYESTHERWGRVVTEEKYELDLAAVRVPS